MAAAAQEWDETFDFVVVGSGGGALTAALVAADRGQSVLVVEKTDLFGGTTAYSGGGVWFPNNEVELAAGVPDSPDLARTYLEGLLGNEPNALMEAYLEAGPKLVAELSRNPHLDFWWMPFPDYYDTEGSLPRGRGIFPEEIAAEAGGENLELVRPPLWPATDPVIWGHALVARFLNALAETDTVVRRNTALARLIRSDDRVTGIVVDHDGVERRIEARTGVLLACGGFDRDPEMRRQYQAPLDGSWSLGAPGNTGDGIRAALEIGAAVDLMDQCWWTPGVLGPSGGASFLQGLHGGVIVNAAGERFANECLPYDRFGRAMMSGHAAGISHIPSYLIFDQELMDTYGVPSTPDALYPGADLAPWFEGGFLWQAETLADLAKLISLPADAVQATVERFNGFAKVGKDHDFGRGEEPYDLFFVAPVEGVNAALKQIRTAPYYAVAVVPSDLGTKGGLVTDVNGRVLEAAGDAIPGLYATGNTMAAWSQELYPGPGVPVGSSMAFGYLAALHAAHAPDPAR